MFGARKIAGSAVWRTVEVGGNEAISFLFFVIMTRLLVPEQFGIIALAGAMIQLGVSLLQQGIADAMIQREKLSDEHVRSAFWAQLMLALVIVLVLALIAWPISWLLRRPEFPVVLLSLAPVLILQAMSSPMHAMLRRSLDLKSIALRTLMGTTVGGAIAIMLAREGAGQWALVVQQWTVHLVGFLVLCWVAPVRPWNMRRFQPALRELVAVARPIMISQFVANATRRLDILILGLFLGNFEVGIFFLITRMVYSVQMVTQHSIGEISLVVLSRLQSTPERHRDAIRKTLQLTAFSCALCFGLLAILTDHLVPQLFGEVWHPAEKPLQLMSIFATFGALTNVGAQILISGSAAHKAARLTIAMALVQLAMILVAAQFGLMALAWAIGLAQFIVLMPALAVIGKHFKLPLLQLLRDLAPIVLSFLLAMALAAMVPTRADAWGGVILAAAAFGSLMCVVTAWMFRDLIGKLTRPRDA